VAAPGLKVAFSEGPWSANLDVATAALEDTGVRDGAFDQAGLGPWVVAPGANWAVGSGSGGASGTGQNWLKTNTGSNASSWFAQDIATAAVPGRPYTGSIFLRSLTGGNISVAVVIWALGGPHPTEVGQTLATVGPSWQEFKTELDVTSPGHVELRFQVYVSTPGQTLGAAFATLPDVARD